jgi:hypothetical protein
MLKRAIWFSQHVPSPEQLEEIKQKGFELIAIEKGRELGSIRINSLDELIRVNEGIDALITEHQPSAVFGVIPVPLRWDRKNGTLPTFESWNVNRALEGSARTHSHKQWLPTGNI